MPDHPATDEVAKEVFSLLGTNRQVAPFSTRYPDFNLSAAYNVVSRVREMRKARSERAVGRKIGFTNRSVWSSYGISGPMWNYMFNTTVGDLAASEGFPVASFPEPRIEPEIVLHLAEAPRPGMDEEELIGCVDWIAHGFEIVHSIFPNWQFSAADAAAAYGVHSGLLLGEKHRIDSDHERWARALQRFTITMTGPDGTAVKGNGENVLGSPLTALRFLVEEIARHPRSEPLHAGEIITTGTLTEALPAVAGEYWETKLEGIELEGERIQFS